MKNKICRYLDTNNKGYVTLGDVLITLTAITLAILFCIGVIGATYYVCVVMGVFGSLLFGYPLDPSINIDELHMQNVVLFVLGAIEILILYLVYKVCENIDVDFDIEFPEIKLWECPRKK